MGDDLVTGKDPGGGYGGDQVSCPSCAKLIPRSASFGPAEDRVYLCPRCQNVYKPPSGVPKGRTFRSRHVADKSELVRSADGGFRFRARCTCGWASEPVSAERVIAAWEEHCEEARSRRNRDQPPPD